MSQAGARWGSFVLTLLCIANISAKEIKQTRNDAAEFIGAIGCKSSSCHGGAGPKREQYTIWSRRDFHARAFAILTNARSARLAETIGGGEASTNARCTVCHSPFQSVAQARLASTAHPDEGVSCESCHGAAGPWLRGHTRTDWTYPMRVTAGMRDLRSLYVRANTCVACHQNVDNDLLKAGHPTLVFELDSQSINQPKHWRDDDEWNGARVWLTGQAVALRELSWWILQHGRDQAEALQQWDSVAWLLSKVITEHANLPLAPNLNGPFTDGDLIQTQNVADQVARKAATLNYDEAVVRRQLYDLLTAENEFSVKNLDTNISAHRARRLVLALDSLTAALNQNRAQPLKIDKELKILHDDVRAREDFAPARFAEHLRALRSKL